jgi:hypothetical protein
VCKPVSRSLFSEVPTVVFTLGDAWSDAGDRRDTGAARSHRTQEICRAVSPAEALGDQFILEGEMGSTAAADEARTVCFEVFQKGPSAISCKRREVGDRVWHRPRGQEERSIGPPLDHAGDQVPARLHRQCASCPFSRCRPLTHLPSSSRLPAARARVGRQDPRHRSAFLRCDARRHRALWPMSDPCNWFLIPKMPETVHGGHPAR